MKDLIETLEEYAIGFINVIAPPEEDVKELLEHIYNQDKEIERLQKENQILMNSMVTEAHTKETKEIERLNNIIGEAIEYIEERYNGEVLTHTFDKDNVGELLEILDKVSDKE